MANHEQEPQQEPDVYFVPKVMGGVALALTIIGGVEEATGLNPAAEATWSLAGATAFGALAGAT
jgi:hypothetical protein